MAASPSDIQRQITAERQGTARAAEYCRALIAHGMGDELHWFPGDANSERLAMVMVGMANTRGGIVLLGVSPRSGHIQGITDISEAMNRVFQAALLADPPLVLPLPRVVTLEQGPDRTPAQVLWVTIPAGLSGVYSLEGRYLGREGTQTNPLPARKLRQLFVERGAIQFEAQTPPGASLDDLDTQKIADYVHVLSAGTEHLPGGEPAEEILLRRGCLRWQKESVSERRAEARRSEPRGDGQRLHHTEVLSPTYAGLLLFGQYPQQWLPNATILAARFSGASMADQFLKQEIAGALPDQLRQAEAFVRQNVSSVVRLNGLARHETTEYPLEAVRELLVNAVAHRDYNQQGDNVHLNIFSDRIEVQSPGVLPGPINLENLLEARFSRNVVIVQALSDLGFVERLGYGLDRVVAVMEQNGLRPPRFEEVGGSFRVTLYGEAWRPADGHAAPLTPVYELNPRQELALSFLGRQRRITNRDYQELCPDVHPETLRRDLADLVGRGLLVKIGDKRATYYMLKK